MITTWTSHLAMPLLGGVVIGLAVSLMLLFNGRVTGISGIIGGALRPEKGQWAWRIFFILGLVVGGFILKGVYPQSFVQKVNTQFYDYIIAGLLVGYGTLLGNGCTSGHGVCGISRFSIRSIIATVTFIVSGMVSVLIFKLVRGEL